MSEAETSALSPEEEKVDSTTQTTCCVVGGGPAGVVLALLFARAGIPVILLEAHKDFDRDFRGDTLHAGVMEIMDQIGLADRLLALAHGRISQAVVQTSAGPVALGDFSRLKTRFPFATMMAQSRFLECIVDEAKRFPSFQLVMRANVQRLIMEDGIVKGVRYRGEDDHWHEVRALLTVGADGRFSKVRSLAGIELVQNSPEIDVLWMRVPRKAGDPGQSGGASRAGRVLVVLQRPEQWQLGLVIPKGKYQELRAAGLDSLRQTIVQMVPWLADRVDHLQDWRQVLPLSVQSGRVAEWHRPGLLLVGDAAHVMSPVCSVGINYAIQDSVVAYNVLKAPLKAGEVKPSDLAKVKRQRLWPIRVIQAVQAVIQKRLFAAADSTQENKPWKPPLVLRIILRLPLLRNIPGRLIHFGMRKVRLEE